MSKAVHQEPVAAKPRAARSRNWPLYLMPIVRQYQMPMAVAAICTFLSAVLAVIKPWPLKVVIDLVLSGRHHHTRAPIIGHWLNHGGLTRMQILNWACVAALCIAAAAGTLAYISARIMGEVGQKVIFQLRQDLFAHLQRLSLRFHDSHRTGDLLTRLTSDIQAVQDAIATGLISLLSNTAMLVGMIGMMFWLDWRFAIAATLIVPLLAIAVYRSSTLIKSASRRARQSDGLLASVAQETLASIRIVQGLSQEDRQEQLFRIQGQNSLNAYLDTNRFQAELAPAVDILAAVGLVIVMRYGTVRALSGALTTGDVVLFFAYVTGLYRPLRQLARMSLIANKAVIGLERVAAVLDETPEVHDRADAIVAPRFDGTIEFRNVSFEYVTGRPILNDISLKIPAGQQVAIVGSTGAGKSTLASLIPRLYDANLGTVLIDGQDIRTFQVQSVREQVALVLQDALLFSGTLRENITFGCSTAKEEEIELAARTANIWDFICSLPDGLDTHVAERGASLSGGQKQRIAIARAVLRNAAILILDEPTSGLDTLSEMLVMEALQRASSGRTTIMIAHRLTTTRFADLVLVMENGMVVESGSPDELLRQKGMYARLYELQQSNLQRDYVPSAATA